MDINREQLMQSVSAQMPPKRWKHTEGVVEAAIVLANTFGADPYKAEIAAILHDVAKYWPAHQMKKIIEENGENIQLLDYDKSIWHAEVGACVAKQQYGIEDEQILHAIRWHTSGRVGMSLLDKVVCVADYIEVGRYFPGVNHIRQLAQHNLDQALLAGLETTILSLLEKKRIIYPLIIMARNDLIKTMHTVEVGK